MEDAPAIILFAHGARDPEWAAPFQRIKRQLEIALPRTRIVLAYLEIMPPTLEQAVEGLRAEGVVNLAIAPLFMAQGGHLKRDLPALVESVQARHEQLSVRVLPPIGDAPEVLDFIAGWIAREAAGEI